MTLETLRLALAAGALAAGAVFMIAAALALLRLPDPLSRLHGVTKAETAGLALTLAGAALAAGDWRIAGLAAAAWVAVAVAGASAAHFIALGAMAATEDRR